MKRLKNCTGLVWHYWNHPVRGNTWAAEAKAGNALFCAYGYKRMKDAIAAANKGIAALGWALVESWVKESGPAVEDRQKRKKLHQRARQKAG